MSAMWICMKLLLVMPATNATSQRAFSALRRVTTYFRKTMSQQHLNKHMVLHVHNERTDAFQLKDVGNEFMAGHEKRYRVFGEYK